LNTQQFLPFYNKYIFSERAAIHKSIVSDVQYMVPLHLLPAYQTNFKKLKQKKYYILQIIVLSAVIQYSIKK